MHYCWVEDTSNTSTFSDNSIVSGPSAKIRLMIEREEGVDALVAESREARKEVRHTDRKIT